MGKEQAASAGKFDKIFQSFDPRHTRSLLFADFCTLAAVAIQNTVRQFLPEGEVERLNHENKECATRYSKEELEKLSEMLDCVAQSLTENPEQDFLGDVFMKLGFNQIYSGQFFTPYHVSRFMASVNFDGSKAVVEEKGYITVCDPCVGAGSMLIASFNAARAAGIEPERVLATGIDIDPLVIRMAYIQCSLLGVCGEFIHGDALGNEFWRLFRTPMYFLNPRMRELAGAFANPCPQKCEATEASAALPRQVAEPVIKGEKIIGRIMPSLIPPPVRTSAQAALF